MKKVFQFFFCFTAICVQAQAEINGCDIVLFTAMKLHILKHTVMFLLLQILRNTQTLM